VGQAITSPSLSAPSPISERHLTDGFDCGKAPLNDWLKTKALKSEGRSARCYVTGEGLVVAGYYSLSTGQVTHKSAPRALRANLPDPTPVMVLGRLAADRRFQGHGVGKGLLKDAILRTISASRIVGARALIVHAVDEQAIPFYISHDFRAFPTDAKTMFLPLDLAIKAL